MERVAFKRKGDFGDGPSRKSAKNGGGDSPSTKPKMSFAAKMMAKMGYQEGQGLGKTGDGILSPIEVKQRPQGVGVGAVKEKTAQAKAEARRAAERRGEEYEDSSEEERKARRRRKEITGSESASGASTPGGFTRTKVKYRTAADIEAAADGLHVPSVLKSIIDATGKETKLLTSAAGLMTPLGGTSSSETEAEKIAKRARMELEAFADAWNEVIDRKKTSEVEEEQLQREIDQQQQEIRKVQGVADAIAALNRLDLNKPSTADEASARWEEVVAQLETIEFEYRNEIQRFSLSDAAVAAIHPLFRQEMLDWEPLEKPMHLVPYILRLRTILGIDRDTLALSNGGDVFDSVRQHKSTTAYETMIYTLWLPKIRTAVTNQWDPHMPTALIALVEAWKDILPPFVYHNVLNQLIVQKLSTAVQSWNPRTALKKKHSVPLPHVWLFPWLQYLSSQHTDPRSSSGLLADVKRKFRVALDSWDLSRGVMPGLENWREVLRGELDNTLIRHLLPRLALHLSAQFKVDPSEQDLEPLKQVLKWNSFFKPSIMAQLLLAEFFPQWLNVLHLWLTSEPDYEEVGQWFTWWREQFPDEINAVRAVSEMWDKGLEMMNHALDLGDLAKTELPPPRVGPERPVAVPPGTPKMPGSVTKEPRSARREVVEETTFKDVVEAWCGEENLLLVPLREAHETTGLPLFRITASATGKGGVLIYLKGDVVWAQSKKDKSVWEPVGLEESLVLKAEGK
ncbi:G-patch domain-containing protein [Lepidopterella palustris CBS 459.81]|uniref:G-patch domain-containing protein n=1 Tax=Lepidopterella palustris CBS 459.81 TaxID=1314670 RepID=A0A8E2EAK1_9PEZI|nr:G-patch domain-containing protein [Lepidopterella palustris CBS 459.81]